VKICRLLSTTLATVVLLSSSAPNVVLAQSKFVCSGGSKEGRACQNGDDDCFVNCSDHGSCILVQGVCDGGEFDSRPCDCPHGTCFEGICISGAFSHATCRNDDGNGTCGPGIACGRTWKLCVGGADKGHACSRDAQCRDSTCLSTGKFCSNGDFADFACVDDADCTNGNVSGTCRAADFSEWCANATSTPTFAVPTPTPASPCAGDCSDDGQVTINEIVQMVDLALGIPSIPLCRRGDGDSNGEITIEEILRAVQSAIALCR
jgi:hypothetical protein